MTLLLSSQLAWCTGAGYHTIRPKALGPYTSWLASDPFEVPQLVCPTQSLYRQTCPGCVKCKYVHVETLERESQNRKSDQVQDPTGSRTLSTYYTRAPRVTVKLTAPRPEKEKGWIPTCREHLTPRQARFPAGLVGILISPGNRHGRLYSASQVCQKSTLLALRTSVLHPPDIQGKLGLSARTSCATLCTLGDQVCRCPSFTGSSNSLT